MLYEFPYPQMQKLLIEGSWRIEHPLSLFSLYLPTNNEVVHSIDMLVYISFKRSRKNIR